MRTIPTLVAALFGMSLAPAAGAYQFTTIDHPESIGLTYALSVDNHGDVGGAYLGADGALHGYVLRDGQYHAVEFPGASQTICGGVEDNGRLTGTYFDAQGFQHGFRYIGGQFSSIDVPGAGQHADIEYEFGPGLGTAAVRSANDLTIGWYADGDGQLHGFDVSHGAFHTIDVPGGILYVPGYGTQPIALDQRGTIGGSYVTEEAPHIHGFLRTRGQFTTFDVPGAGGWFGTQINGINDAGAIAGPYTTADDHLHGFVFQNGQLATVDVPGAPDSEVDSINDQGVIVGEWYGEDGLVHAYIATP